MVFVVIFWCVQGIAGKGEVMRIRTTLLVLACAFSAAMAQNPPTPTPAPTPAPATQAVQSPEVSADGRVTLRLTAPNAKDVFVSGFADRLAVRKSLAMEKDDKGIWSVTTDALQPNIYAYSFVVDGMKVNDAANPDIHTAYGNAGESQVLVPGPNAWTPAPDVPRGALTRHFYHSDVAGDDREFWVYTPAGYNPNRKPPYPVLYLLGGLGDRSDSWIAAGPANTILDNLIAQGKARPMLVVMPLGYGNSGGPREARREDMLPAFSHTLIDEVMPRVEKAYNVSKDRNERAIAGLSMGGAESTFVGLNHLDKFAWIGSFSGAYVMWPGAMPPAPTPADAPAAGGAARRPANLDPAVIAGDFPALNAKANAQIRLLWIACGTADRLVHVNRQFKQYLDSENIKVTYTEVPYTAHDWPLWRENLTDLAALLFQAKK
jgi:enterochelin esterase family protein